MALVAGHGLAAGESRHARCCHPRRFAPKPEGVTAWFRYPCAVQGGAAEYGVEVDGPRQDGNDSDLLQRGGRGAADARGADVDTVRARAIRRRWDVCDHAMRGVAAPPPRPAAPETGLRGHGSRGGRPGRLRQRRRVSPPSWTAWPPSFLLASGVVSSSLLFSGCVLWAWAALLSVQVCFGSTLHYTALWDCLSSSKKRQRYSRVLRASIHSTFRFT